MTPADQPVEPETAVTDDAVGDHSYSARDVLAGGKVVVDTIVPTVIFAVLAGQVGVGAGASAALAWCAVVLGYRLAKRQRLVYALSGLGAVVTGVVVALATGGAEGFFLPGIIGNVAFGLICLVSVPARRPAVAYTSAALYRWPLGWYFHPQVRPAYAETTIVWGLYYLGKGAWQYSLVQNQDLATLTTVRLVLGWPGLAVLLVTTYAYINWRLRTLDGPDVQQYRAQQATAAE